MSEKYIEDTGNWRRYMWDSYIVDMHLENIIVDTNCRKPNVQIHITVVNV